MAMKISDLDPNDFDVVSEPSHDKSSLHVSNINPDDFEVVEPSYLDTAKQKASQFGEAAIDQLPLLGGTAGGVLGGVSPVPGGAFAGAGLGAYAGEAAKNLINTYRGSQDAPKEASEFITRPLQEGAWSASGEGIGNAVGSVVGKGANKAVDKSKQVGSWIAKKLGKTFSNIPENYTEQYLARSGDINKARPEVEILDELSGLHSNAEEAALKTKNNRIESSHQVQDQARSVSDLNRDLRQNLQEDRFDARGSLQDAQSKYSQATQGNKESLQNKNANHLMSEIGDAIGDLKKRVSAGSQASYDILDNTPGSMSVSPAVKAIENGIEKLKVGGKVVTSQDQRAIEELTHLKNNLSQFGDEIPYSDAKAILQRLGQDTDFPQSYGSFADTVNRVKAQAHGSLNSVLKQNVPEYASHMPKVEHDVNQLSELNRRYGDSAQILNRLGEISSTRGRTLDLELLKDLGKKTGRDFGTPLDEVIRNKDILSNPRVLEEMNQSLPQYAAVRDAENKASQLSDPKMRNQIMEKIKQSEQWQKLQQAKLANESAKNAESEAASQLEPFSPFSKGRVQSTVRNLTGARDYGAKKAFEDLDQATQKNFTKEVKDRAILNAFEKTDTQGSRKTLMGKAAGGLIGGAFGLAEGGDAKSSAIGAGAGFAMDKYSGVIMKGVLDGSIKVSPLLQKAAERGSQAFGVALSVALRNPEMRDKILNSLKPKE